VAYDQSAWENQVWTFVFSTVEGDLTYGGPPPDSGFRRLIARAKTAAKRAVGFDLVRNPFFVLNGICDAEDESSSCTASYLRGRLGKSLASTAVGFATGSLKAFTVVDPTSMAMAGASIGSTIAHMTVLTKIAEKWKNSTTITGWIDLIMKLKLAKLGHKAIAVVAASIPYLPPGTSTAIETLAKLPSVAGVGESIGVSLGAGAIIKRVAIELHWRAYREQVLARKGGAVGPASAILVELFTKRAQTQLLGKHQTDLLIKEPAGWMAIADKIGLL